MKVLQAIRHQLSMPLLTKELVEQAARKRTYIVRVIYALLIFGMGGLMLYDMFYRHNGALFELMGRGEIAFKQLVAIQFVGIAMFLPALMCSAITGEKENNSLVLLMVTDLRPTQILMQKYLGRLMPMMTFLLLSLPLMAVTYAMGGVTTEVIKSGIVMLVLGCMQVGAMTLMLSAWCRSTGTAFVMSYLFGAMFFAGPPLIAAILWESGVYQSRQL